MVDVPEYAVPWSRFDDLDFDGFASLRVRRCDRNARSGDSAGTAGHAPGHGRLANTHAGSARLARHGVLSRPCGHGACTVHIDDSYRDCLARGMARIFVEILGSERRS